MTLEQIKKWAEEISGQWDGDKPGRAEDRAHQAQDVIDKVEELSILINEMENL